MPIKNGVDVGGLKPEILLAYIEACFIWREQGERAVITSGLDGRHMLGSKHYTGNAIDLRTRGLLNKAMANEKLASALGSDYDVVLEDDHIHVEYDPKQER